ncbi:MAG TPA: aspartate--tRNA ligase [Acidimicrobiia bacterium]|nr:aspartate--tRNA ligase [Acidimicrobiia bacterium]
MRTHRAGDLRSEHIGQPVALAGWVAARRDHGGVVFVDLRDAAGVVQVVVDPQHTTGLDAHAIRAEYVLRVEGEVRVRPEGTANPDLPTGDVEVAAVTVELLNAAEPPPIPIDERVEADEVLRLRYRYLDLRSARLQRNLRLRAMVNRALRQALDAEAFVEVETPMLIASTPEGARDFVVPSRLSPGEFYALPQSPQLFKQLLMVGGLDRYYQIARCLRDEDLRADRQFEFMQLDAEMSFATADDVMGVIGRAVAAAAEAVTGAPAPPVERMTWHEAMERFGTDKPDLRFGMELVDVGEVFAATEFKAFQAESVKAIRVPGEGGTTRSRLDGLIDRAKQLGAAGLVWMRVGDGRTLDAPILKFLADQEQLGLVDATGAQPGDLLLIAAGDRRLVNRVLGTIRLDLGRPPVHEGPLRFLWVVDFPLFEALDDDGRPVPAHHPFTMPHPDDLAVLARASRGGAPTDALLDVRSLAYDLVLNGWELGSGSVRIHRPDVQEEIFTLLGIDEETARQRFGFLLDAFRYGAPPHAGFAFGIDRLTAILAGEENIREVIAFPKTQSGADPLTGAPTPIDPAQLRELGLSVLPRPRK